MSHVGNRGAPAEPAAGLQRQISMTLSPQPHRHNATEPSIDHLGDMIASIPGILGYYPQESAVVVSLLDDARGGAILGPVICADLAHTESLVDVLREVPVEGLCGHLAVIVSRIPNSDLVRDAVDALYAATDSDSVPLVDACWHVSEIALATPYTLVFGPSVEQMNQCGMPQEWVSGTVSSVLAQAAMEPLLAEGALPELDKGDTHAFFDRAPGSHAHPSEWPHDRETRARVQRQGRRLQAQLSTDRGAVRDAMAKVCEGLVAAAELPLVGGDEVPELDALFERRADAELLAATLTSSQLRDCLLTSALENPRGAASLFLGIARNFDGIVRANALSIWAVIAVELHLAPWAWAAIECAQEEVPGHSMSAILGKLLRIGEHEGLIRSALLGSAQMWRELEG